MIDKRETVENEIFWSLVQQFFDIEFLAAVGGPNFTSSFHGFDKRFIKVSPIVSGKHQLASIGLPADLKKRSLSRRWC